MDFRVSFLDCRQMSRTESVTVIMKNDTYMYVLCIMCTHGKIYFAVTCHSEDIYAFFMT